MKLRIVSFGHKRDEPYGLALLEYQKRIVRPWSLELVDLPSGRRSEREGADQVMQRERQSIEALGVAPDALCLLDADGKQQDSKTFADWLLARQDAGTRELVFVIGGADGIDAGLKQRTPHKLSLSRMTFPHRLARLMLAEQLYRAQTIVRGEKYHK